MKTNIEKLPVTVVQKYWPSPLGTGGAEKATDRLTRSLVEYKVRPVRVLTCGDYARGVPKPQKYIEPIWEDQFTGRVIHTYPSVPDIAKAIIENTKRVNILQIGWGFEHFPEDLRKVLGLNLPTLLRTCETGHFDQFFQAVPLEKYTEFRALLLNKIDRVVAISSLLYSEAKNFGFPEEKIRIIHSTIPTETFKPERDNKKQIREKLNLPQDAFIFLFVGRFVKEKGVDLLINEWKQFGESLGKRTAHLVMVGDNKDFSTSQETITFPGIISDEKIIADYYKAADVFVYPTMHNEGLALAAVEAMSSGLPVLTTEFAATETGMKDLILPGKTGWSFTDLSPSGLAQALHDIYSHRQLTENMGDNARQHVLKLGVDNRSGASKYDDLYLELTYEKNG